MHGAGLSVVLIDQTIPTKLSKDDLSGSQPADRRVVAKVKSVRRRETKRLRDYRWRAGGGVLIAAVRFRSDSGRGRDAPWRIRQEFFLGGEK